MWQAHIKAALVRPPIEWDTKLFSFSIKYPLYIRCALTGASLVSYFIPAHRRRWCRCGFSGSDFVARPVDLWNARALTEWQFSAFSAFIVWFTGLSDGQPLLPRGFPFISLGAFGDEAHNQPVDLVRSSAQVNQRNDKFIMRNGLESIMRFKNLYK